MSSAPSSTGTADRSIRTSTPDARVISTRCPSSPNPVTSVHAVAAWRRSDAAASRLDWRIAAIAPSIHRPFARSRISAANRVPVPIPLVSTSRSPGRRPPLRRTASASASPVNDSPRASSAPSAVCPPTSAAPASLSTSTAPASSCARVSSTFRSSPNGTVATASAVCASAPIAKTSPRQWLAAISPNTNGSSTMARKASTVRTSTLPGGTRTTAASSGASRPTSTSSRRTGVNRASTRSRGVAPTFDPQPPQRIAAAAIARRSSGAASPAATAGAAGARIAGRSAYRAMNRRSIQSLQRHARAPSNERVPRPPTA